MPVKRPRFETGITFAIRKLKITPCMPWNRPNPARNSISAHNDHGVGRIKPDSEIARIIPRMPQPVENATGNTRLRCSIRLAPIIGVSVMPNDCSALDSPTARFEPPDSSMM